MYEREDRRTRIDGARRHWRIFMNVAKDWNLMKLL